MPDYSADMLSLWNGNLYWEYTEDILPCSAHAGTYKVKVLMSRNDTYAKGGYVLPTIDIPQFVLPANNIYHQYNKDLYVSFPLYAEWYKVSTGEYIGFAWGNVHTQMIRVYFTCYYPPDESHSALLVCVARNTILADNVNGLNGCSTAGFGVAGYFPNGGGRAADSLLPNYGTTNAVIAIPELEN